MLTFVIPVGPYHEAIAERAVASCLNQSLKVSVVVVYDHDRKGTGWARNRGLAQVQSGFCVFLDADDFLDPAYAETMLRAYDGWRYCYSDWVADKPVQAPDCAWKQGTWHIVTALLPTAWVRYVGGFDETLRGGEDTELFVKLTRSGLCGKRVPEPLVHYTKGGQRGRAFVFGDTETHGAGEFYASTMQLITERYGDKPMPCCNDSVTRDEFLPGEAQAGDVLASLITEGSRQFVGRASGRLYRRVGNSRQLWMDARDIDADPARVSRVIDMPGIPSEDDFQSFAHQAMRAMTGNAPVPKPIPEPVPAVYGTPGEVKPDVGQVLRLYANTQ